MKELRCPNCGGYINPKTYVCEYCGARFEKPSDNLPMIKYVVEHPEVRTLACATNIRYEDVEHIGTETLSKVCVRQMSESLAEQLEPFITVEVEDDRFNRCKVVKGRVRLVDPDFRFM